MRNGGRSGINENGHTILVKNLAKKVDYSEALLQIGKTMTEGIPVTTNIGREGERSTRKTD